MKSNTPNDELKRAQLWLVRLRGRLAIRNRLANRLVHPTLTTFMSPPKTAL